MVLATHLKNCTRLKILEIILSTHSAKQLHTPLLRYFQFECSARAINKLHKPPLMTKTRLKGEESHAWAVPTAHCLQRSDKEYKTINQHGINGKSRQKRESEVNYNILKMGHKEDRVFSLHYFLRCWTTSGSMHSFLNEQAFQHNSTHKFYWPICARARVGGRFSLFACAVQLHTLVRISMRSCLLEGSGREHYFHPVTHTSQLPLEHGAHWGNRVRE